MSSAEVCCLVVSCCKTYRFTAYHHPGDAPKQSSFGGVWGMGMMLDCHFTIFMTVYYYNDYHYDHYNHHYCKCYYYYHYYYYYHDYRFCVRLHCLRPTLSKSIRTLQQQTRIGTPLRKLYIHTLANKSSPKEALISSYTVLGKVYTPLTYRREVSQENSM
jgi:hypothetical protein